MIWAIVAVCVLLLFGSLLAMAEASMTRTSRVRAMALREEGKRNAGVLERIQEDPARYLNSVYLTVMFAQNGSAVLVGVLADRMFGELGITLLSIGFTLVYFVIVEAMSKTYGVLHSDRVALALAPLVAGLARLFALPVRALIGVANVLLPGKGLKTGPFVSEEEIRQMAEVGHESGAIEEEEKDLIHSIFEFGDTLVREVMTPRPDMVVVEANYTLHAATELAVKNGFSRIPVYDNEPDNIVGVLYTKDLFRPLRGKDERVHTLRDVIREAYFVPETMKVSDLLREMQRRHVHMAIVVDEYGDVAGLVTLEDVLEEIVGEITDEYDVIESHIQPVGTDAWRVQAKTPIWEFNESVKSNLHEDEAWDTIGGLVASALAKVPEPGDVVRSDGFEFRVERVNRRRIGTVLVRRSHLDEQA
ncbi:MAG TPA: hemolysin family protein [Actinomycetota bacterium]|jgi:CBS domain containing-hemolysin-like protein|nr:hemolysin family protein [Actinomycetota bacterium]